MMDRLDLRTIENKPDEICWLGGGALLWWLPPEGSGGATPHQADLDERAQPPDQEDQRVEQGQ